MGHDSRREASSSSLNCSLSGSHFSFRPSFTAMPPSRAVEVQRWAISIGVMVLMGAVALGLGAVAAAPLPRTRVEDDLMGAQRDRLMEQAELTLRDEIARARATGEAARRDGLEASTDRLRHH